MKQLDLLTIEERLEGFRYRQQGREAKRAKENEKQRGKRLARKTK